MKDEDIRSREFQFLLIPGFSLLAVSAAIDVLRAANLESEQELYCWNLISDGGNAVASSSGLQLPCVQLPSSCEPEQTTIVICGGATLDVVISAKLSSWLKTRAEEDLPIGSLSDGAFIAAECGLFDDHKSTTHWKNLEEYRARFPTLEARASILELDGQRFSCAGGTASLDLFLQFVLHDLGTDIVARIAENYFHDSLRDSSINQHVAEAYRFAAKSRALAEALRVMSQHLEQPMPVKEVAMLAGTTHRSLNRLFDQHLQVSPGKYYRRLRLNRAANLLLQTGLSVSEIANACGFGSASHLGLYFKEQYAFSPKAFRQQGFPSAVK